MIGKVLRHKLGELGVAVAEVDGSEDAKVKVATATGLQQWNVDETATVWQSLKDWDDNGKANVRLLGQRIQEVEEMLGRVTMETQADWQKVADVAIEYGYQVRVPRTRMRYTIELLVDVWPDSSWLQDGKVDAPTPMIDTAMVMAAFGYDEDFEYDVVDTDVSIVEEE